MNEDLQFGLGAATVILAIGIAIALVRLASNI